MKGALTPSALPSKNSSFLLSLHLMIQDKVHSVKTEQEKCSVFFALLGQSSPFILQEMGFLKNSTTYFF